MTRARWIWIVAGGLVAWWCVGGETADRRPFEAPQTAVTSTGFVVADGAAGARRISELTGDGAIEWQATSKLPEESRVVGTLRGVGAVWRDGTRVVVAAIEDDGELSDKRQQFGKKARRLCDGVATDDGRWAVGWLEGDGGVWIVHGATVKSTDAMTDAMLVDAPLDGLASRTTWCAVASGGDNVVLIFRRGNRVFMNECSRRECSGFAPNIPDTLAKETILDVGCVKVGCGFATRDAAGATRVTRVDDRGRAKWTAPLAGARRDTTVEIIGAGDRQFAVAYATGDGAAVVRLDGKGNPTTIWRAAGDDASVPSLAWSKGRLLVARTRGGSLVNDVVALPR